MPSKKTVYHMCWQHRSQQHPWMGHLDGPLEPQCFYSIVKEVSQWPPRSSFFYPTVILYTFMENNKSVPFRLSSMIASSPLLSLTPYLHCTPQSSVNMSSHGLPMIQCVPSFTRVWKVSDNGTGVDSACFLHTFLRDGLAFHQPLVISATTLWVDSPGLDNLISL